MTDTATEIAAVFIAAGWAPHFGIDGYARQSGGGWLVGGAPDPAKPLRSHLKITAKVPDGPDTPDDPVEAARVLVRLHGRGVVEVSVAPESEADNSFSHETATEPSAQTQPPADTSDALDAYVDAQELPVPLLEADGGEASEASAGTDLSAPTSDLGADILDAEYDEAALGLPAPEPQDFAPDEIKHPEPPGAGAFIFGDSLDHDRLIRQGQIQNHADMLADAVRALTGFNDNEFHAVQSHVVTNLNQAGGYTGGDESLYARFVALSETRARLSYIDAHRKTQIDFIRQANHQQVSEFDPTEGWP